MIGEINTFNYLGCYFLSIVKLALNQATKNQRENKGVALLFLIPGAIWWVISVNAKPRPICPQKDPVPIVNFWSQSRSGRVIKPRPWSSFDPGEQPVECRFAD
jgi:hypothetical protein